MLSEYTIIKNNKTKIKLTLNFKQTFEIHKVMASTNLDLPYLGGHGSGLY